jgi:hypothetical protein
LRLALERRIIEEGDEAYLVTTVGDRCASSGRRAVAHREPE